MLCRYLLSQFGAFFFRSLYCNVFEMYFGWKIVFHFAIFYIMMFRMFIRYDSIMYITCQWFNLEHSYLPELAQSSGAYRKYIKLRGIAASDAYIFFIQKYDVWLGSLLHTPFLTSYIKNIFKNEYFY